MKYLTVFALLFFIFSNLTAQKLSQCDSLINLKNIEIQRLRESVLNLQNEILLTNHKQLEVQRNIIQKFYVFIIISLALVLSSLVFIVLFIVFYRKYQKIKKQQVMQYFKN